MEIEGYRIEPLTPERFGDLEAVLGRGGIGGCWCMWWAVPTTKDFAAAARGGSTAPNKEAMRRLVDAGPPPGLLAYEADAAIAWCRVVPRATLPGLARSRRFKTDLDIDGVWSLPCFVVRATHRGLGLTSVLTRAAMVFARDQGATILEVYPRDTDEDVTPSSLYNGRAATFRRLGFEEVQRRCPDRPMMRLELG